MERQMESLTCPLVSYKRKAQNKRKFNLLVGERSFSGRDQLFPLLFLPLVAKNAAIAMLVRFK